jgi:hypothetical protein
MSSTLPAAQLPAARDVVTSIFRPTLDLAATATAATLLAAALVPPAGARPVGPGLANFGLANGEPVWALAPDRSVGRPDAETRVQLFRGEAGTPIGTLAPVPGGGVGAVTIAGAPGALAVARQTVVATFRGDIGTPMDSAAVILPGTGPAAIGVCAAPSLYADINGAARRDADRRGPARLHRPRRPERPRGESSSMTAARDVSVTGSPPTGWPTSRTST